TFYAEAQETQTAVLVCDLPDLWMISQAMRMSSLADTLQLIASTEKAAQPKDWTKSSFWDQWSQIYVATPPDNRGERIAEFIAQIAGKPVHRLKPAMATWYDSLA